MQQLMYTITIYIMYARNCKLTPKFF